MVYANVNSSEEDYSFLITALYHWETLYPTFTLEYPKDPIEIVVKEKEAPPKEEEKKKEEAPAEPKEVLDNSSRLLQHLQDVDQNNVDLQELINMQKQQILQSQASRGGGGYRGRGGMRGGYAGYSRPSDRP